VALAGIVVNLMAVRILGGDHGPGHAHAHGQGHGHDHGEPDGHHGRSLNVEGSYRHIVTDLFGFVATAAAAVVIIAAGFDRADAIASVLIALVMLYASYGLLRDTTRVFMEAAPTGLDPDRIGQALAEQPGVVQVHDLHVWEVTSGFPALSAHVVVRAGDDCHERRRQLQEVLRDRFNVDHTTLQVDHEAAVQPPLQIEVARPDRR
jgi:cobalt-zinc-cadmium efflux system protein